MVRAKVGTVMRW